MNDGETRCRLNLAETCVSSLSVGDMLALSGRGREMWEEIAALRLTYGEIPGSLRLRTLIAGLYSSLAPDQVLVTHGAAGANSLVHSAIVHPGDVVVSVLPAYQQHYSIPEALGAVLRPVWLRENEGWGLDLGELAAAAVGAKTIVLTNPNNPTGALLSEGELREIAAIAERENAWIVADEVYRGTNQAAPGVGASLADLSERAVVTGSMSKAFSLAGLRVGWVAGARSILEAVEIHRDYTTISVSLIDDLLASAALEVAEAILERSRRITRENLAILDAWISGRDDVDYVRPASGTTALLRYSAGLGSYDLCSRLLDSAGVLFTPGAAFGVEGTIRIGYADDAALLSEGLTLTGRILDSLR